LQSEYIRKARGVPGCLQVFLCRKVFPNIFPLYSVFPQETRSSTGEIATREEEEEEEEEEEGLFHESDSRLFSH